MRFQSLYRLSARLTSNSAIDCPSTPAAPWLALTRLYASHISLFGISNGFALFTGSSHRWLTTRQELNNATPSVQSDYRTFLPTTGCSAPVPHFGTLILAGTTRLDFSLCIRATGSHVPRKSQMQSHALHAGCHPDSNLDTLRTYPGLTISPRF